MQYIGIPTCPYCKKRVNIIRAWSMKKHGEFMCPRCKGISNIYLSPIVYIAAILAIAASFLIYFFSKFVTDSVSLMTVLQVFIPFGIFFIICLFFVYLEKPVIRRVKRTPDGRYFDENGNEMKMKMGKLVSMTPNNGENPRPRPQENINRAHERPVNTTRVRNSPRTDSVDSFDINRSYSAPIPPPRHEGTGFETDTINDVQQLPVGNVVRERTQETSAGTRSNSGFEDLFDNYSPTRQSGERQPRSSAPRQTQQRTASTRNTSPRQREPENQERKKSSGGSRFRDL